MSERMSSFEEFWPHYLSEHRHPTSRRLHFLGTCGFLGACGAAALTSPLTFVPAIGAFAALAAHGTAKGEKDGPRLAHLAGMLGLPSAAAPAIFPAGVAFAYACAWIGHFGIEGNRPATFEYPLWSFVSDLRMFGHMVRGRLWKGDPLEELGLRAPSPSGEEAAAPNGHASVEA